MEILQELRSFVKEELLGGEVEVALDDNLLKDGMVDSIGMMRLVAFIEENYQVNIQPEDLTIENFQSVQIIGAYLQRRMNGSP